MARKLFGLLLIGMVGGALGACMMLALGLLLFGLL